MGVFAGTSPSQCHFRPETKHQIHILAHHSHRVYETLIPEAWHLELTPVEHIRKLNIAPIIIEEVDSRLEEEADLRVTVMIGDRLF